MLSEDDERELTPAEETAAILADPDMVAAIRAGREAIARGDVLSADELLAAALGIEDAP